MSSFERSLSCAAVILAAVSFGCPLGCTEKPPSPEGEVGPSSGAGPSAVAKGAAEGAGVEGAGRRKAGDAPSPAWVPGREGDKDPRTVFLAAQSAMKARDFGLLFDLLSGEARERFHAALKADAETSAGAPFVKDVLGFDPRECAKLPPRRAFVKVMEDGIKVSEQFAAGVGSREAAEARIVPQIAEAKVVDVGLEREPEGETATVTVEWENGPVARRRGEVKLVLEDGKWRLAGLPWLVGAE